MDSNKTFVVVGAHGNMPPVLTGEEAASVCDTMISTSLSARSELEKELAVITSRLAKMDQTIDQELLQTLDSVQDEKVRLELFLKDMKRRSDGYLYCWPEIESVSVDSNDGVTVFTIHYIEYTVEENAEPFSKNFWARYKQISYEQYDQGSCESVCYLKIKPVATNGFAGCSILRR